MYHVRFCFTNFPGFYVFGKSFVLSDFRSFSLLMLIIVNIMFYLFYLKVEPVLICVSLINAFQITSVFIAHCSATMSIFFKLEMFMVSSL